MSIRLYSGLPGSGKTYRIVYDLMYGDLLKKYYIFCNIPELKIENPMLKKYGENTDIENYNEIFTLQYQKEISDEVKQKYNKNILWIIDECDKIGFGTEKNAKIKEWLSMHRHMGQDIYLISQNRFNINKELANLIEVEIQGKKGFIFNAFIYSWLSNGERFALDRLPKKKEVYKSYRSFHVKEIKKKKSKIWIYALILGVITIICLGYFLYSMNHSVNKYKKNEISNQVKKDNVINDNKNNLKNETQKSGKEYFFAGKIKNDTLISDQFGNIYLTKYVFNQENIKEVVKYDNRKMLIYSYRNKIPMTELSSAFIMQSAALSGAGRAPGSDSTKAQEQKFDNIRFRELWIDIR